MDLEGITLSEISQRKTKYHMISLICGIYKKQKTKINEQTRQNTCMWRTE